MLVGDKLCLINGVSGSCGWVGLVSQFSELRLVGCAWYAHSGMARLTIKLTGPPRSAIARRGKPAMRDGAFVGRTARAGSGEATC